MGKGHPGNQHNAKGRMLNDALRKALVQYQTDKCPMGQAPHEIANNIVSLAVVDKDRWAIEFIFDRMDGKPKQAIEHSGSVLVESVSEEHARQVAESFLDSLRSDPGDSSQESSRLHDSLSPGLPSGPATP